MSNTGHSSTSANFYGCTERYRKSKMLRSAERMLSRSTRHNCSPWIFQRLKPARAISTDRRNRTEDYSRLTMVICGHRVQVDSELAGPGGETPDGGGLPLAAATVLTRPRRQYRRPSGHP